MKAIEVNKGDTVKYKGKVYTVFSCGLNLVSIVRGFKPIKKVSYSQIEKYEQE